MRVPSVNSTLVQPRSIPAVVAVIQLIGCPGNWRYKPLRSNPVGVWRARRARKFFCASLGVGLLSRWDLILDQRQQQARIDAVFQRDALDDLRAGE